MIHVAGYEYQANTACLSCRHVFDDGRPVNLISHDEDDGTIQFLCGATGHSEADAMVVGLKEVLARFPARYFPEALIPGSKLLRGDDGIWVLEQ